MDPLERFTEKISRWFTGFALMALNAMLILVTLDIIGAKVFSFPVPGAMDLTSLLGLLLIGFSMPQTYLMGRHIQVNFVMMRIPRAPRRIFRCLSMALCTLFFVFVVWRLFLYAHDLQVYGEQSLTVKIPLYPFGYALAVAFLPMLLAVPIRFYRTLKGYDE
ncbi:MAG: TRAP transporter small permease subunit [Deltaproteobacteria bacterium]|nr:TRAP transporter small permease subunit [Deltaproteobacteria bacterium]